MLNFLVSGGFLYSRTPAETIYRRLGNTARGGVEAGDEMKCRCDCGVDAGQVGFRPRFVSVDGVWKDFWNGD